MEHFMNWQHNTQYLTANIDKIQTDRPVAAFDLDDTLIKPKKGGKFSEGRDDWLFFTDSVPQKLQQIAKTHQVVIISNQKGMSNGKVKREDWTGKLDDIQKALNVHLIVLAATESGSFRKPQTGLWDKFLHVVPLEGSFYCGDAGGLSKRIINGIALAKDFSQSDYKFALNIGIPFIHRDEWILNHPITMPTVEYPVNFADISRGEYPTPTLKNFELIINVGYPGCGKTTYTKRHLLHHGIVHVNQDTLKTPAKCLKACENALKSGKSCVIDNTNMTTTHREKFMVLGKKYGASVRCLWFKCPLEHAVHNNRYRNAISNGKCELIPMVSYYTMRKKFQSPKMDEGFDNIETIDFQFVGTDAEWQQYARYLE